MKYTILRRISTSTEVHVFVILPRVLPRATAEILIMVFDHDPRCYRYTRSKKRRCTKTTGVDYLLECTTLSFTFYAYILRLRRGGRAIVIREEFVASAPLCAAIFLGTERDS